jgi:hypothetical protein
MTWQKDILGQTVGITYAIEGAQTPPTCRGMKNTHQQLFGI